MDKNSVKIDGVSYNIDHAKAIGKEAWLASNISHHFQHIPEADRKKAMGAVYDQIVAPLPTGNPAAAKAN